MGKTIHTLSNQPCCVKRSVIHHLHEWLVGIYSSNLQPDNETRNLLYDFKKNGYRSERHAKCITHGHTKNTTMVRRPSYLCGIK